MRTPLAIARDVACELWGHNYSLSSPEQLTTDIACKRCDYGMRINWAVEPDFLVDHKFELETDAEARDE